MTTRSVVDAVRDNRGQIGRIQDERADRHHVRAAKLGKRRVRPALGHLDAALDDVQDFPAHVRQAGVEHFEQRRIDGSFEELHLVAQRPGVVIRLGVNDENIAVRRSVLKNRGERVLEGLNRARQRYENR